jgi:hypothetical protein
MKYVKMRQINGAWYSSTSYSSRLIRKTGLGCHGRFLSLTALANDLAKHNISVKTVK